MNHAPYIIQCRVYNDARGNYVIVDAAGLSLKYAGDGLDEFAAGSIAALLMSESLQVFDAEVHDPEAMTLGDPDGHVFLIGMVNKADAINPNDADALENLRTSPVQGLLATSSATPEWLAAWMANSAKVKERYRKALRDVATQRVLNSQAGLDSRPDHSGEAAGAGGGDVSAARTSEESPAGKSDRPCDNPASFFQRPREDRLRDIRKIIEEHPLGWGEPCEGCSPGSEFRCSEIAPPDGWCPSELAAASRQELASPLSTELGRTWLVRLAESNGRATPSPDSGSAAPPHSTASAPSFSSRFFSWIASPWRGLFTFACRRPTSLPDGRSSPVR